MSQRRNECVAMLLAGGQGSRLKILTEKTAKPAVSFGGKYRIIDFTLSNCVNSGIDTVGILTQYQPLQLNAYIGNGQPWGLNRNYGGARVLPPYAKSDKSEWYKGTANAIYQNMEFIELYNPKYVLILSGDHIYKMDYSKMIKFHVENNSECTIAVREVPLEEASRFGIMNTDESGKIVEFEEKPKNPKSTKASMGIYIFNWSLLKEYLIADEKDKKSSNDFGKNIIPNLLNDKKTLLTYPFKGYWKDVGTIESLWQANMDILNSDTPFNLKDKSFKIYARNYANPCSFISGEADAENSLIAEGCSISGKIYNSIISTGVKVGKGTVIKDSIIMPNAIIKENVLIDHAIIGEKSIIGDNAHIGNDCKEEFEITVVGNNKKIKPNKEVNTKILNQSG